MGRKVDLDVMVDARGNEKDNTGEFNHREVKDPRPCNPLMMDVIDVEMNSSLPNGQQTQCLDNKQAADPEAEQNQVDVGVSCQEKVIKKPDKILPCPRCNSMDTKFCYYNNYNVNQPRHFCKSCQRYWTAGGTMRNVPVGAGKRKSKHSASHHRQLLISSSVAFGGGDELSSRQAVSCGASSVVPVNGNGAGKFVKGTTCGSVGKMTDPEEQKGKAGTASMDHVENGKLSSVNVSDCTEDGPSEKIRQVAQSVSLPSCNGLPPVHPLQCYPGGPPWAYPWNPAWNNFAALAASGRCGFELVHGQENFNQQPFPWNSPQIVASPAFCPPAIPLPFVPASFWGCMPSWPNGSWGMPWVGSPSNLTSSTSTGNSGCSVNNSPLGKHSRQSTAGTEDKKEKSIWIPKTLRIDDPDEAAKSSIWATLGIKPGKIDPSANGGIFKGFQPLNTGGDRQSDATQALHANPAALCRSQTFQESS